MKKNFFPKDMMNLSKEFGNALKTYESDTKYLSFRHKAVSYEITETGQCFAVEKFKKRSISKGEFIIAYNEFSCDVADRLECC